MSGEEFTAEDPQDSEESTVGEYQNGVGEDMSDAEVRRMLEIHLLDGWSALYEDVDVTLHRDGGATIHLELNEDHVTGIAQTW